MSTHVYHKEKSTLLGTPYRLAYVLWRRMPLSMRTALFTRSTLGKQMKITGRDLLAKFAGREDLYSAEYYAGVDAEASRSAPTIVACILSEFAPKRVIDLGCGTGAVLSEFRSKGVSGFGLEYSAAALTICQQRGLDVHPFDIEADQSQEFGRFDVAICFEVAEHVSARFADRLVDLLVQFAPCVIFTAATPGQGGGADHVNEQPHEYWIAKFDKHGYRLLKEMSERWRHEWEQARVTDFYAKNVMIFEKI